MKKVFIVYCHKITVKTCLLAFLIATIVFGYSIVFQIPSKVSLNEVFQPKTYFEPGESPEGSVEEAYRDIFMSFLTPYIEKAVYDYYGQPFSVDPWSPKILSLKRPDGYRSFFFILKLEVVPYYGPHHGVGIDHITLTVRGSGKVNIERFEHIKTYEIPPNPKVPMGSE